MTGWPTLPYESIGKATVVVLATVLVAVAALVLFLCLAFLWYRGWDFLTRLLWLGSAKNPNRLPAWRLEASIYAQAIKNFDRSLVSELRDDLRSDDREDADIQKGGQDQ